MTAPTTASSTASNVASPESTEVDPRSPTVRLGMFFDDGEFELITPQDDRGVLVAVGRVAGAPCVAFATDPTVQGGAMGNDGCRAIVTAYDRAFADSVPVVGIWHSGGARLREGVLSLDAVGRVFAAMTRASGKVPQISVVLGPAAGGAAYGPALTDLVILGPKGRIFVTGPEVVKSVTGEAVDMDILGGPEPHGRRSGVVHITTDTDQGALDEARTLVSLLEQQGSMNVESVEDTDLGALMPESSRRAYDVHPLIEGFVDHGTFTELHAKWAPNIVVGLGRLGGARWASSQTTPCAWWVPDFPARRHRASCRAACRPCRRSRLLPGLGQEWEGAVRRGAKLLHAFAECVVPRVTVVTRKAYGGAYVAMNSASLGATKVFAWPDAEVAVMGAVAAIRILHRKRLAEVPPESREQVELELAAEHEVISGGIKRAVEMGVVHDVVDPIATKRAVAQVLWDTPDVRGQHGNIPL